MNIVGKTALITGGAHRVGKAICEMFASAGANVAFTFYLSNDLAARTVDQLSAEGVSAMAIQCDITEWDAVHAMSEQVEAEFGGVDIIVNSAGLFKRTSIPTDDIDLWQRITRTSIDGTFHVCNAVAPGMLEHGGGVIVNILDSAIRQAWPGFTAHAVAKSGMLALTRQLAVELSPSIRTNAIVAGPVLPPPGMQASAIENVASRTLLKRWGKPSDIAAAVKFLIESDYITGEILTVDGGERYAW